MIRLLLRCVLTAALFLIAGPSIAQEPGSRAEEQAHAQEEKARALTSYQPSLIEQRLLSIENAGGFGVARGFVVKFGDIKRGSGFAPGVGYGYTTASGAVFAGKAGYSIKNYKLLQLSAQSPHLAAERVLFGARARWQDVPRAPLYPLGTNPPEFRSDYAESRTELSGRALVTPVPFVRLGGGIGIEWFQTAFSHDENPVGLPLFNSLPGAGADPRYLHSQASAAIDFRESPGFTRRGSFLSGSWHDYRDSGGSLSFQRLDGSAEQYLPILHGNWVIYLGLWASTTMTGDGQSVPFFLMPDLGGHDLRAFSDYRFRDRHSINWTAEYRWYAQEFLEAAIFYDAGKTVSTRSALDFNGLHGSIGAGVRLHTATATLMRVELAHSEEGLRFLIGFSPVGK